MPVSGDDYREFGGATSCYLVQAGDRTVFLDGGSGLVRAPATFPDPTVILLSHLHVDHLLGLGMYSRLSMAGTETGIYVPAENDHEAARLLGLLYAPPLWPVRLTDYAGNVHLIAMPKTLRFGNLRIDSMQGNHPGGSLVFRLRVGSKSIVYVTDYEHEEESFARLSEFAHGADLLLYDGQYDEEGYVAHKGFGHSTPQKGVELMRRSGARRLLVIHHDPECTDEMLRERERALGCAEARFARVGEMVVV